MIEQTLVILKPDCIQRKLAGEVISRIEKKGLKIVAMKMSVISEDKAKVHYAEHKEKPFFGELIRFITSGPVILLIVESLDAILLTRKLAGATKPINADPGTIRGDYVVNTNFNIIHTSDSSISAEREINNFFTKDEILSYNREIDNWI